MESCKVVGAYDSLDKFFGGTIQIKPRGKCFKFIWHYFRVFFLAFFKMKFGLKPLLGVKSLMRFNGRISWQR